VIKYESQIDKTSKVYCCYSLNLRNYLYSHGLKYEVAALNPNSQKMFWIYVKTKYLDDLLTKWSAEK
jgi:hypothetical protein